MGGLATQTRIVGPEVRPDSEDLGYRAQRLTGLFGDPIIASLMAALRGTAGGPNVGGQMLPGSALPVNLGNLSPSQEAAAAQPAQPVPAGSPVTIDPLVALVIEQFRQMFERGVAETRDVEPREVAPAVSKETEAHAAQTLPTA